MYAFSEKNIHYNYNGFVELLKNCKIKLNQFFNTNSISFNKYLDSYVDELNNFLYENNNLGYDIAYIKDDFYKSDSTNVHISPFNFSLDPHPNKNGHHIIYEKIINLLNEKSK